MSYMNQHMANPVTGIRGSVNVSNLDEILKGTTWVNFQERHVSDQEYGNTKFNDLTIVAYYFKHRLGILPAALAVGYSDVGAGANLINRLKRINMANFLAMVRALIKHKLITLEDIRCILSDPVFPPKTGPGYRKWHGATYKWYAKRIVMEAIHKWGGKRKAAKKLNVKLKVVQYWAALNIKDPMIKHTQNQ